MKTIDKIMLLSASVCGTVLILAGCQKDNWSKAVGKTIDFGAKSAISSVTKTSYSGVVDDDSFERIDWTKGDMIRVASDKAKDRYTGDDYADYLIDVISANGSRSEASIKNIPEKAPNGVETGGGNGLVWAEGEHTFWGIYPSKEITVSGTSAKVSGLKISPEQGIVAGTSSDNTKIEFKPEMQEAYMLAKATVSQPTDGKKVELPFYPAFTALEFTLMSKYEKELEIRSFTLTSKQIGLTGTFEATIDAAGRSTFKFGETGNEIIVDFGTGDGESKTYPSITNTTALPFTVLALPQNLKGLTIDFSIVEKDESGSGVVTHRKLDLTKKNADGVYDWVEFAACHKSRIYGLAMPSGELLISYDVNPWKTASEIDYESNINTWLQPVESYRRYDFPEDLEDPTGYKWGYVQVSYGYLNPENGTISGDPTELDRPKYSRRIELHTKANQTTLQLHLDNPKFKFVRYYQNGTYIDDDGYEWPNMVFDHEVTDVITIEPGTEPGKEGEAWTWFYVVPVEQFSTSASKEERICRVFLTTTSASVAAIRIPFNSSSLPGGAEDSGEIWFYYVGPSSWDTEGTLVPVN